MSTSNANTLRLTPRRILLGILVLIVLAPLLVLLWFVNATNAEIGREERRIEAQAALHLSPDYDAEAMARLPAVVRRYLDFAIVEPARFNRVEMRQRGMFRRPGTEAFNDTSVRQVVATGTPALLFDATTSVFPGIWARAYDAYADGEMVMKAKILSALTVVDERESEELNAISLRRWLLESPLYPVALLPGGPVTWEAIDENRARAIVRASGLAAALVATFRADGSLASFEAEEDGDLTTPYHGSGEHVTREDYQLVSGMMIPMAFTISRAAQGRVIPFWSGRVTDIRFR